MADNQDATEVAREWLDHPEGFASRDGAIKSLATLITTYAQAQVSARDAEIARLRANQRTEFSIEKCGKCGLEWDGEWDGDKCYWPKPQRISLCPVHKAIRSGSGQGDNNGTYTD